MLASSSSTRDPGGEKEGGVEPEGAGEPSSVPAVEAVVVLRLAGEEEVLISFGGEAILRRLARFFLGGGTRGLWIEGSDEGEKLLSSWGLSSGEGIVGSGFDSVSSVLGTGFVALFFGLCGVMKAFQGSLVGDVDSTRSFHVFSGSRSGRIVVCHANEPPRRRYEMSIVCTGVREHHLDAG